MNDDHIGSRFTDPTDILNYTTFSESPFYQGKRGLSDNGSSSPRQIPLSKREGKIIKCVILVFLSIAGTLSFFAGLDRGVDFIGEILPLLLFGVFMPYVFIKGLVYIPIRDAIKKRRQPKQLELPL